MTAPLSTWKREGTALHADCRVYRVLRERWKRANAEKGDDFFVVEVGDWAVAVALTDTG